MIVIVNSLRFTSV